MVLFFISTLCVSLLGLAGLLYAKHWELTTNKVLFADQRPQLANFFHTILFWVERVLPTLAHDYALLVWRATLRYMHTGVAYLVLKAEKLLERILHTLRHTTEVERGVGQASDFLRQVAEHKKKLKHREL
jgi:hypothetical protein